MTDFDLGIEHGTLITGAGRQRQNIYVRNGKIAEVTSSRRAATERFDANGLLVMPGMVDVHVHFMDPGDTDREDFEHGSAAGVRAGVTTVIEHTHLSPVRTATDLQAKVSHTSTRSRIDFGLAAHAWPGRIDDVVDVWAAGAAFVKAFTCTTHGIPGHDAAGLFRLFEAAARGGISCLVHCEDESLTHAAEERLRLAGRTDGSVLVEWRSREAELVAAAMTSILARRSRAAVAIAHVSHSDIVDVAHGTVLETCPQYLTLLEDEVKTFGSLRKFTPPARARSTDDLAKMWRHVAEDTIAYIASDHAPSTREQKGEGSIWEAHFGLPGIDTTLPILLDGAHSGRLTYERVVSAYSEAPSRIYGLRGKGGLHPGADADMVIVDPEASWTVHDGDILSKAGWSSFAGRSFRGRAVRTYTSGRLAAADGEVLAQPGWGRFLAGRGAGARGSSSRDRFAL